MHGIESFLFVFASFYVAIMSTMSLRGIQFESTNSSFNESHPFLVSRRRLERILQADSAGSHNNHKMLHEVDGLKNSEIVYIITSTTNNNEIFLWDRVIPSARTWMRHAVHVYVVVEGNNEVDCSLSCLIFLYLAYILPALGYFCR
jgi:hypothetical protein